MVEAGTELAGRYRLGRRLGVGGMGEVWQARDLKFERDLGLRRDVAVKLMHSTLTGSDMLKRFQQEAVILSRLNHPHIVRMLGADWHDGQLFIVMELLAGQDLGQLLSASPRGLPVVRAVELARQLAAGLSVVHAQGIVHRDLKPANLFVLPGNLLKIGDFGVARDSSAHSVLTAQGVIMGTWAYIAPERWLGTWAGEPGADLYSMGCILYELLTGETPFVADSMAIIRMHCEEVPEAPLARNRDVPAPLNQLVLRLLEKDPGGRPADAAQVAAALAGIAAELRRAARAGPSAAQPNLCACWQATSRAVSRYVPPSTYAPATDGPTSDDPQPRRHLVFAIVAVALVMASLDATIVSTALKPIQEELHAPITWGAWTITAYNLAQVVVMPLAGKISDLYGRKRVFLCAALIFAVSSLLCGTAQNIYVLVGLRALQAIGGGAFMPSASGIVADQYGRNKARALGLFTSIFSIGGVTGPVVGGFIVTYWSWRGVFFVNIPFCIVMIVLAAVFLPSSTRQPGTRLDVWGAATLACFLLSAMFSITELGDGASALSTRFLAPLAGALVAVTLFIRHSRRAQAPFVPARLLVGRGFGTMNLVNVVFGAFAIGASALLPLYAQDRYGIPPLESGTLLTIRALGMICVTGLAVMAMHRTGYRRPILLGIFVVSTGLILVSLSPLGHVSPYLWLSVSAGITGLGIGVAMPAANNATIFLAPTQVAAISGLRGMFRQAGGLTAISIATAVAAQAANPGHALGIAFLSLGVVALCILPLAMRIPEERVQGQDAAQPAMPGGDNAGDTDESSHSAASAAA